MKKLVQGHRMLATRAAVSHKSSRSKLHQCDKDADLERASSSRSVRHRISLRLDLRGRNGFSRMLGDLRVQPYAKHVRRICGYD
jgi:hypothetical protein